MHQLPIHSVRAVLGQWAEAGYHDRKTQNHLRLQGRERSVLRKDALRHQSSRGQLSTFGVDASGSGVSNV